MNYLARSGEIQQAPTSVPLLFQRRLARWILQRHVGEKHPFNMHTIRAARPSFSCAYKPQPCFAQVTADVSESAEEPL